MVLLAFVANTKLLKRHLGRQLQFLRRSCDSWDAGFTDEGIRIAVQLRVLVHTTGNSTSLLAHLGARETPLLTTVPVVSSATEMFQGMGMHELGGQGPRLLPNLGHTPYRELVPAPVWWRQPVVVLNLGTRLTRRDIALAAANKDGGAHVDPNLTPEYERLSLRGAYGFYTVTGPEGAVELPVEDAHLVCLRQMGYELLHSPALSDLAQG